MSEDHEVDWGNDEDDPMVSRSYFDSVGTSHVIGDDEADDVEDAVSLGGDEEEEFAAYGARPNEQNTHPADRSQSTVSKRNARRRSASVGASPRKGTSQVHPAPLPPSPQSEIHQPTPKLTHALPPKPVVSSVRAPPSTTAASPMSLPRKERRSNGNTTKKGDEPPPSDKETRGSRTADRDGRQRDSRTEESSWTRPSSTDSQPLSRDRTRSFDDRDSRPPLRREDDCYRPSHHRAHYSSDEEGREPNPHRTQSRYDARYRYDDRDQRQDYASGDRNDRPVTRSARFPPEVESLDDRSRTGYRESNDTDPRRAHPRDRDISPARDDSSRRLQRRDDYSPYDSFDKGPRVYDDPPRRSAGAAERSRYPESFNGRTNSVVLRDSHTQNQGPGRSSTLRRSSPSPRPRSRTPPYHRRDDRRHSPPRFQEYPPESSRLPPYRGRVDSPPPRPRCPDRMVQRDTPTDLPQRRPRGISDAHEPDYAPKRRKMDDGDINFLSARRGPVGTDTYIPQETSTASTSPRSTGAPDDLSRQRRREPLPLQSHRFKEASDMISRPPPLSGPNRIMRQPQPSALSHRHYPPSPKDQEAFSSRHPDTDMSRFDRSRDSGHDPVYVDKFSRDDHMKADPPYQPRVIYEEPVRSQDVPNRTSSHNDAMSRERIPPTSHPRRRESVSKVPADSMLSAPVILENARGRSRDHSPRTHHYHEPRRTNMQPSSAVMQPGPPQDMQFVEDHRHRERRIDREREGHSPTLLRSPSNLSASGRYDMSEGGLRTLRSPERHSAPSVQEQLRFHDGSNLRRERLAPPVTALDQVPSQLSGDTISMHSPIQERPSRSGPPPDIDVSPAPAPAPPPPPPPAREWIPRQPEFMSSLPPPSTRLPGAPPPPILPSRPYDAPRDPIVHPRPTPQDESTSINLESEPGQQPPQEKYRQEPLSPDRQMKDKPRPRARQPQEGHHEQAPPQSSDRTPHASASVNLPKPENLGQERHISTANEEGRRKVSPEIIPASWDRPRDIVPPPTRKPLTLPASLPPKPVAALGDLKLQQPSSSLRTGHSSRGRRNQQQLSEESNNHGTRWGSAPRGDGGRDKDKERNSWGGAPEYQGPSLLARMSTDDSGGRGLAELVERVGGEVQSQRKRARTRKYHGQGV